MKDPLPRGASTLARPLSALYGLGVRWRNRRFDRGRGVVRLPVPVISVGNLSVGGTGKTPCVAWIAEALRADGRRPMIALRGYGAADPQRSDERLEYAEALPGTPVAVGADRVAAVERLLREQAAATHGGTGCVLLDDGFQHRRIHRDLDLVLIDRRRPALDGPLLPAGWLREPPSALARADAVIVTHARAVDAALAQEIARWHGRAPLAWFRHVWTGVGVWQGAQGARAARSLEDLPLAWLAGRRVVTALGIGNPTGVAELAAEAGAEVVGDVPLRDHQRWNASTVRRASEACRRAGAEALLVTRKDWVKLREVDSPELPLVAVPRLALEAVAGGEELLARIRSVFAGPSPGPAPTRSARPAEQPPQP